MRINRPLIPKLDVVCWLGSLLLSTFVLDAPSVIGQDTGLENLTVVEDDQLTLSEKTPQVVRSDRLHDFHFAFSIARPSGEWKFLSEEKAQSVVPGGVLVMTRQQAFMAVIVERVADTDLQAYCNLAIDGLDKYDPIVMTRKRIVVDGEPATQMRIDAKVESIPFIYLFTVIKRGDWFYKVTGWTTRSRFPQYRDDLDRIGRSVKLNREKQPTTRRTLQAKDSFGPTWELRDGVYANAVFGFRLTPTKSLRALNRRELLVNGQDAVAGLSCNNPTFNQMFVVERTEPADQDRFRDQVIWDTAAELQITLIDPEIEQVTVGGLSAKQYIYRNTQVGGLPLDIAQTVFFRGKHFFRLQSWWFSNEAKQAEELLSQSYQVLTWLDQPQMERLTRRLTKRDASNVVGKEFCLRSGVYHDFQYGFRLELPEGLWRASAGDAAKTENEDARLIADLADSGCHLNVIPDTGDYTARQYHDIVVRQMDTIDPSETQSLQIGEMEFLKTEFDFRLNAFQFRFHVITTTRGNRHIQLVCSTLKSNQDQLPAFSTGLMKGLTFPKEKPKAVVIKGSSLEDHRLGFALAFPEGWTVSKNRVQDLESPGSTYLVDRAGPISCAASGVCIRLGAIDQQLLIDSLLSVSSFKQIPGTLTEFDTIVDDRPAKEISFDIEDNSDEDLFATVWILYRGNTVYTFLVVYDYTEREGVNQYKQFFYLLD